MHETQARAGDTSHTLEGRATWGYVWIVVGLTGAFFLAMTFFLIDARTRPTVLWFCWAGSLFVTLCGVAETRMLRVVVTETSIEIRRLWGTRRVPLADLRGMRTVKAEYVIQTTGRFPLWLPPFITNLNAIVDRLQRAIAANIARETMAEHARGREPGRPSKS